jgi:hypothetical protein
LGRNDPYCGIPEGSVSNRPILRVYHPGEAVFGPKGSFICKFFAYKKKKALYRNLLIPCIIRSYKTIIFFMFVLFYQKLGIILAVLLVNIRLGVVNEGNKGKEN